jgi:hypothetical protein
MAVLLQIFVGIFRWPELNRRAAPVSTIEAYPQHCSDGRLLLQSDAQVFQAEKFIPKETLGGAVVHSAERGG